MTFLPFLPSLLLLWLSATMDATAATTSSGEPHHSSSELRLDGVTDDPNRTGSGQNSNSTARYKLFSPAKLPISRSPCITIPPGLSPSSFLESPVLLSNMKVSESSLCFFFFSGSNWIVWFRWKLKVEFWGENFKGFWVFLRESEIENGKKMWEWIRLWNAAIVCLLVQFGQRWWCFYLTHVR